jgi:hypothetical protein
LPPERRAGWAVTRLAAAFFATFGDFLDVLAILFTPMSTYGSVLSRTP